MARRLRSVKLPWLPFYVYDWRNSPTVQAMSHEQRGLYFALLLEQWAAPHGSLPDNLDELSAMLGLTAAELAPHWLYIAPSFPRTRRGRRANPKLASIREHIRSKLAARRTRPDRDMTFAAQCPDSVCTSDRKMLTAQRLPAPIQRSDLQKKNPARARRAPLASARDSYLAQCPHDPPCQTVRLCGNRRDLDTALAAGRLEPAQAARLLRAWGVEG